MLAPNSPSRSGARPVISARNVFAATVGNALEFYNFVTYSFFAIQIGKAFFPSESAFASLMLSLATFGAGFATRPLGGIVLGAYADRVGRRAAMVLSLSLMGGSIVALALIPTYAAIGPAAPALAIVARMAQGFALGGEVGPTTAYLLEAAPPERRGLVVALQGASQQVALVVGSLVGLALAASLSGPALAAYGWRIAFLFGGMALPFGVWLRRAMPETLHAPEAAAADARAGQQAGSARIVALGLIVLAGGTIGQYVSLYMTTYVQNTLHLPAELAFAATALPSAAGFAGLLSGGWLSDRIGRRPVMIWPRLAGLLATMPVFWWIIDQRGAASLLIGLALLAFATGVAHGAFYAAFTESLPKRIRGCAFGTTYAIAIAIFGGTTQLVVTWLLHVTADPAAPAWYALAAGACSFAAMALIKESAPVRTAAGAVAQAAGAHTT